MPRTAEVLEELARRYYLTTALVEEAGHLFDSFAESGEAQPTNSNKEPLITVPGLQQLMVRLGTPLTHQDVEELLRFFGSAAAVAIRKEDEVSDSPGNDQQLPMGKGSRGSTTATGSQQAASRQGGKKSGASTQKNSSKSTRDISPKSTPTLGGGPSDVAPVGSSPLVAPQVAAPSAITEGGMNFTAFVYFLLVYPELAQRASGTVTSTSTLSASAIGELYVNVPELFSMIDADGDGVWSVHDLRRAAEACVEEQDGLLQEDPDLLRLTDMPPAELATALHELDVDGDGVVTVNDVRLALYY
ncbi:hypothetical protein JKF63_04819 [Porcisia hertigi]|uniref:Uncharacterized protein n=1 Tax=Porcisia hertigi TaxID=2761500 RepID=A0A836IUW1_9TRYP|nr:hypothetical protein JKF63_04819 [Porcisia hertigi]